MTERIFEALNKSASLLNEKGLDVGAARILMEHVTGKSHAALLADIREPLSKEEQTTFWNKVEELLTGTPVQYVIGEAHFYGRIFEVDHNVLIPRPETEELIHSAIERGKKVFHKQDISVADIGTGSGAIAISFKKEWPEAIVTATDISSGALAVAKRNAQTLGARITFQEGNMTEPLQDAKWDLVLSNPPYIAHEEAELMSPTVLSFEPHHALFAEEDGLYFYRKLAENLPQLMNKPALIGVEIGYMQGPAVHELFVNNFPDATIEIVKDINGKDRMLFCEIYE